MTDKNSSPFTKKDIWLWALYDFANSIAFVAVIFYFSLWFVADLGGSDVWISVAVALSTVLLLFTLPFLGHLSDRLQRRMPFITALSLLCIAALLILGLLVGMIETFTPLLTLVAISVYFFFMYFYQSSLAFYNAFLQDLSATGVSIEKISGIGAGLGQLGNLAGLVVIMPFALGKIPFFGLTGKSAAFAVAGILFLIFYLPTAIWLRDRKKLIANKSGEQTSIGINLKETLRDLRRIRQYPGVLPYLITYYLFADALLTLSVFATLYLEVVGGLDDIQKNIVLFTAVLLGIIGGFISPYFVRLFRGRKKAIGMLIALWTLLLVVFALAKSLLIFAVIAALNGFVFSALFSLSRSFYATLIPKDKQAELFSVYVLFERAASILGPLVWSGTAFLFASHGSDKYRFSIIALAIIVGLSLVTLRYVKEPSTEKSA